jgi:hypothetical protein
LLQGFTLRTGSGSSPNGAAFEVNSAGAVYADNLFSSGFVNVINTYYTYLSPVTGITYGSAEGIIGGVFAGNSSSTAHGVRGINYYYGSSGLVGPANGFDFYADGSGTNYGPFTGTHDSLVLIDAKFTVGDIVVDNQIVERNGISSTIALVGNSTTVNQLGVIGVVCREPSLLADQKPSTFIESIEEIDNQTVTVMKSSYYTACETYNFMPINSVGEGQINVCGENGNIEKGDLIVSSSMSGKGMKQSDNIVRSYTVAKAREAVTFTSPDQVIMVACIYLCG